MCFKTETMIDLCWGFFIRQNEKPRQLGIIYFFSQRWSGHSWCSLSNHWPSDGISERCPWWGLYSWDPAFIRSLYVSPYLAYSYFKVLDFSWQGQLWLWTRPRRGAAWLNTQNKVKFWQRTRSHYCPDYTGEERWLLDRHDYGGIGVSVG